MPIVNCSLCNRKSTSVHFILIYVILLNTVVYWHAIIIKVQTMPRTMLYCGQTALRSQTVLTRDRVLCVCIIFLTSSEMSLFLQTISTYLIKYVPILKIKSQVSRHMCLLTTPICILVAPRVVTSSCLAPCQQ